MINEIRMKANEFINYLEKSKSKSTVTIYKRGLELFSEYYGKSLDEILEERRQDLLSGDPKQRKRFVREIEMYHKWLLEEKKYPLNSASSYCDGIIQIFRYFEMPITLPTGSDVRKKVLTTKDFVPRPEQYRDMFQVADNLRDKLIISMGKDLAWRIGDFLNQRKDQLPNLERETPIPYDCITEKEDVIAKSFLSNETVELLKQYLPTLPKDNPYVFPSENGSIDKHLNAWSVNQILRRLAEKANVVISKRKRLRFHAFRKRFLSTCANLSIDVNIAKILTGKQVEPDMLTYLSEVRHKEAFLKVYDRLRLTEKTVETKLRPKSELEKEIEDLKRLIHGIIAVVGKDAVEKARELAQIEVMPYSTEEIETEELLRKIGTRQKEAREKLTKEQIEEYKRIIEENNNH